MLENNVLRRVIDMNDIEGLEREFEKRARYRKVHVTYALVNIWHSELEDDPEFPDILTLGNNSGSIRARLPTWWEFIRLQLINRDITINRANWKDSTWSGQAWIQKTYPEQVVLPKLIRVKKNQYLGEVKAERQPSGLLVFDRGMTI